jgi:cell division transport system ATP-binding protein
MIQIKQLSKMYKGHVILDELNLEIENGEFVFLNGVSGSGKSTLLKLLYREINPDGGEIWINRQLTALTARYETRRQVGTIFQIYELLAWDYFVYLVNNLEIHGKEATSI